MLLFWVLFNLFVLAMLALDLGLFHRRARVIRIKEAAGWSLMWILLAAVFALLVRSWRGPAPALEFVTGYLLEESLSVDNLFVFLIIFNYFRVPRAYQHKVLFWGIIGALIFRALFIAVGIGLLRRFEWVIYLFGAFLIYGGSKLLHPETDVVQPEKNVVLKFVRRWMRLTEDYQEDKFIVRRGQRGFVTPLFIVLVAIETTDVFFATDSIPAVIGITRDPFIVYTSNVFAVLGLRSIYFTLAGMMELFHHLHYGLAAILVFIGVKMLLSHYYPIPTHIALAVLTIILGLSIAASLLMPARKDL